MYSLSSGARIAYILPTRQTDDENDAFNLCDSNITNIEADLLFAVKFPLEMIQ